jgi:hypothetical protein
MKSSFHVQITQHKTKQTTARGATSGVSRKVIGCGRIFDEEMKREPEPPERCHGDFEIHIIKKVLRCAIDCRFNYVVEQVSGTPKGGR